MKWKSDKNGKILFLSLFAFLTLATLGGANAQTGASSDIVTKVEQRTWIKLPTWYTDKIRNFTINNKVLKEEIAAQFTEDFIIKEMQSNRWISKENQLLFIYCAIWYNFSQDFYTWDDWNDNRMIEFEKVIDTIENCQTRYKEDFISYMQQRSADAQQRSADANKNIMQKDTLWLKEMARFYSLYIKNPNNVRPEEIDKSKKLLQRVIPDCKEYWINYRAILLKEVWWDAKKVNEILKFYGVE